LQFWNYRDEHGYSPRLHRNPALAGFSFLVAPLIASLHYCSRYTLQSFVLLVTLSAVEGLFLQQ